MSTLESRHCVHFTSHVFRRFRGTMPAPATAAAARAQHGYARLLFAAWFWNTWLTLALTLVAWATPWAKYKYIITVILFLDFCHFLYCVSEFFTMEVAILNNEFVYQYIGWKRLYNVFVYLSILSLTMPIIGLILQKDYDLYRLLRIYTFIYFYKHYCKDFQYPRAPPLLKAGLLTLLLLGLTALWVRDGCGVKYRGHFAMHEDAPKFVFDSIDANEWELVNFHNRGCLRMTPTYNSSDGKDKFLYVQTSDDKRWYADFLSGLLFVLSLLTGTPVILFQSFAAGRAIQKIYFGMITYWARQWMAAITISYFYTHSHELYSFAYKAESLMLYLKANGVSAALLKSLSHYLTQLWKKQKGNATPEFATQAPQCLREDIFSSLYMHHFRNLPLFAVLPEYFLRQLVVRVERKTILPGNMIVQEGDINHTMYFIHEGEVERWCTDAKGESKMASVLTMNSHFGVTSGVYPYVPFQYSYYSRTVVELILLSYYDWQDLLDAYPDLKEKFQISCLKLKHETKRKRMDDINIL